MHDAVLDWVGRWSAGARIVIDLGGRDVNGTCRPLFPDAQYAAVDIVDGPGVDIVADIRAWRSDWHPLGALGDSEPFADVVLCTEVFEHLDGWQDVCVTAFEELKPGGRFIVTCAGPGRPPHSGRDAVPTPEPDEHYANISPEELTKALEAAGFVVSACHQVGHDTQALAIKPLASPIPLNVDLTPDPFPHLVLDGVWSDELLTAIVAEFPDLDAAWRSYGNENERKLEGGPDLWGPAIRTLFATLGSPRTLDRLELLTGIPDLSVEFVGGGYHLIPPGAGKLGIHTDFNRSPHTGLYRRLNCLVYLNRGWTDEGGRLELWCDHGPDPARIIGSTTPEGIAHALGKDRVVIAPEFNRTVIFETSDRSWHGHPHTADRWRLSVAAYFFSPEPPPGYRGDHSTVWRDR